MQVDLQWESYAFKVFKEADTVYERREDICISKLTHVLKPRRTKVSIQL